jgi:hypothetical protein
MVNLKTVTTPRGNDSTIFRRMVITEHVRVRYSPSKFCRQFVYQ